MGVVYLLIAIEFVGPIIGIVIQLIYDHKHHKKFRPKSGVIWEQKDIPLAPEDPLEKVVNRKSVEEQFDTRTTNIFRPWGGLFG